MPAVSHALFATTEHVMRKEGGGHHHSIDPVWTKSLSSISWGGGIAGSRALYQPTAQLHRKGWKGVVERGMSEVKASGVEGGGGWRGGERKPESSSLAAQKC